MGHHINDKGQFVSDKYPYLKPDHVILSFRDPAARLGLKILANTTRDIEFGKDIKTRLKSIQKEL